MKCINKTSNTINRALELFLLLSAILCSGCGGVSDEVTFANAYDIYDTSQKYHLITANDTSMHDTLPFFAENYCVSDGTDLGTDTTDSQVAYASGVFNLNTREVTYAQNIYEKVYPASTTKILTAYVALKYGSLDTVYTVSENAANQASDSSVCGLKAGDQLTLEQLLYGLMMKSGNDAAIVIAEGMSGDVAAFAELMNQEARALGATDSHFVNANGLQEEDHYTTVYDLHLIFRAAIQNETFLNLIRATTYTVDYIDKEGLPVQQIWTPTNKYLLGTETVPEGITVIGGKTGTTNDAGYCLVLLSQNAAGEQVVSIVMKADCRNNLYYYMNQLLQGFCNSSGQ